MRKKLFVLLLFFIWISTINSLAMENTITTNSYDNSVANSNTIPYVDSVADILNIKKEDTKINLYYFYGKGCSACDKMQNVFNELEEEFSDYLNIYFFEVWNNKDNYALLESAASQFGYTRSQGTPISLINDIMFVGYSPSHKTKLEEVINDFISTLPEEFAPPTNTSILNTSSAKNTVFTIPILGEIDAKDISLPIVTIVLGFIDGFNPCAMWILLLLIGLFLGMNNRKRAWLLGFTFLFISALIYFLSMFGINFILDIFDYSWLKNIVSLFIIIAGFINIKKYIKLRNEQTGCTVVDDKKRKNVISKGQHIINEKNIFLALIGVIVLATTVNSLELFCSLGFPVVFSEILSINNICGITKIGYILLYVAFYMVDDIIVFLISMITLKATGITNKYNKKCTLVSAIIMIIIGLLLIFKPSWLMLNF